LDLIDSKGSSDWRHTVGVFVLSPEVGIKYFLKCCVFHLFSIPDGGKVYKAADFDCWFGLLRQQCLEMCGNLNLRTTSQQKGHFNDSGPHIRPIVCNAKMPALQGIRNSVACSKWKENRDTVIFLIVPDIETGT
jgi:hypothetical protein